jgi:hypothetical protein
MHTAQTVTVQMKQRYNHALVRVAAMIGGHCLLLATIFALMFASITFVSITFAATTAPAQQQQPNTSTLLNALNTLKTTSATVSSAATIVRDTLRTIKSALPTSTDALVSTATAAASKSGIDTVVNYAAQDSVVYSLKKRVMRLRGGAYVKNSGQTLEAEIIELYFDQSTMRAQSARDSSGRMIGVPKFTDGKETYYGATLSYNFRTKRGTVALAQTDLGEGYYFGDRIKRISENTIFVQNGCYTTCDKPHPHFYFRSPRMKVITQDKLFVDQLFVYVEDIPIFYIPLSVFVENKTGRRSGLMVPQFFFPTFNTFENGRGFVLQNLGYYFAINDYMDATLGVDLFSKGGFQGRLNFKYALKDYFNGSIDLSYGLQRFSTLEPLGVNWSVGLNHSQTITPQTRISASLAFSSPNFNRNTQFNLAQRVQQSLRSNGSISHTFDNGTTVGISYGRDFNIITQEATDNLVPSFSVPQLFPFKELAKLFPRQSQVAQTINDSWLSDVNIQYNPSISVQFYTPPNLDAIRREGLPTPSQQNLSRPNWNVLVRHQPSISIAPKLGYFTVSPQLSYSENWYSWRIRDRVQTVISPTEIRTDDVIEQRFSRTYNWSAGLSIATRLYGIVNPRILGVNSLRHTLQPSLSYTFQPNASLNNDFFGTVINTNGTVVLDNNGRPLRFDRFERDGGNGASSQLLNALNFSADNNFEAKLANGVDERGQPKDTTVQLVNIGVGTSYNFTADSLNLSAVSLTARTSAGIVNINGNAAFDAYDQDVVRNGEFQSFRRVNRLLLSSGKGLLRLTSAAISFQTQFSSQGDTAARSALPATRTGKDTSKADVGERFRQRLDTTVQKDDLFGDNTPGYQPVLIPWDLSLLANFSYNAPFAPNAPPVFSATVNATFNVKLGDSWNLSSSVNYDFINNQLTAPSVNIRKDLHCWDVSFTWFPVGTFQGFNLRLGVKAAQLKDLQLLKRSDPRFP